MNSERLNLKAPQNQSIHDLGKVTVEPRACPYTYLRLPLPRGFRNATSMGVE